MKRLCTWSAALLLSAACFAAVKPCAELKDEIDKKLQDKGAKSYTLDIVDKDKQADGQVVGTCDGGTKKIVYTKGAAPAKEAPPAKK